MATTKSRKRPAKNTSGKGGAKAGARAKNRAHDVLDRLAAEQPALTAVQREAFAGRFAAARCDEMGGRTKSEGVQREAVAWAPVMAKALKSHPQALRRYGAARFVWFLECVEAMSEAREAQQIAGGNTGVAKARVERAEKAAREAREELLEALEALVEGDDEAQRALDGAAGAADRPDRLVASLRGLAALARGWLARKDAAWKVLVESVGLSPADVDAAEAAADALDAAGADKTLEGPAVTRDTPPVNRAEGRVLLEMRAAMRIFARANARSKDVPKLAPGPATRSVLAPRPGKAKAEVEEGGVGAPAEPPAAGGG